MSYPAGVSVTLVKRTFTQSDRGDDMPVETQVPWPGVMFDPGGSVESIDGQDQVVSQPTVFGDPPAGFTVTAFDAVIVGGQMFEVDGSPNTFVNGFTGWQPPLVTKLKAVTG